MAALDVIQARIAPLEETLSSYPELWRMFRHTFMNTIETTVQQTAGDTFVITGDIQALWLRDSTAQVLHYLRFADDPAVAEMIEGLLARQAKCILLDPYANAFNRDLTPGHHVTDIPCPADGVWERKYEIDSLCYPIYLAWKYHAHTGNTDFLTVDFAQAMRTIVSVLKTEQAHEQSPYLFRRPGAPAVDTLSHDGKGAPVGRTGMTWSGFRPSDDSCVYGYLIPSNLFAMQELRHMAALAERLPDTELAAQARALADEIEAGVAAYGHVTHHDFGDILAYETDGLGQYSLMDDANVPSLLSLPYLGICRKDDPLYQRTRAFVLSSENPYYCTGSQARGVGSPHTPKGYIWPIGLCVQAMTSDDPQEIAGLLDMLMHTHADCFCMHESFDPSAPERFTRKWFAWANSMFGEMIYRLHEEGLLEDVIQRAKALRQA